MFIYRCREPRSWLTKALSLMREKLVQSNLPYLPHIHKLNLANHKINLTHGHGLFAL